MQKINAMKKFITNNRTHAWKIDINLLNIDYN